MKAEVSGAINEVIVLDNYDNGTVTRLDHGNRLRMNIAAHEELVLLALETEGHLHRVGCRRALVKETRHAHGQSHKVAAQCLEVEKHFKTSLCSLVWVGSVGRVPSRILEDVSQKVS